MRQSQQAKLSPSAPVRPTRLGVIEAPEIFAPLPPVRWLCQALDLAPGAPALLAGYGYSGKTVAAQDFALAVATGTTAWGRFPVRQGRVLHLDWEQGAFLTRLRYQRLALGRGIRTRELDGQLAVAALPPWHLDDEDDNAIKRHADGYDLVIVDSLRAACPHTDENSSEARVPLDRLTRIAERTGTTFKVIHHARKPSPNGKAGGARMAIRGSGALYDACGSVLVFDAPEKNAPVLVEHEKARISGRTHPNFQLWIEDVDVAGDPGAGLRVTGLDAPAGAEPADGSGTWKRKILDYVKRSGGTVGSGNDIRAALQGRKEHVAHALAELVSTGQLVRGGTPLQPTHSLPGTTYDSK